MYKIKEAIIVEGRDDTRALRNSVDCYIIETHGFHINKNTWEKIDRAYHNQGIIIFTDPDYAGENIRKEIKKRYPNSIDCYIRREDAVNDSGKFGIEYASPESIREALLKVRATVLDSENTIDWNFMIENKLTGDISSKKRRVILGNLLGIGYGNAKTFFNRINSYGVSREELEKEVLNLEKSL